MGMILMLLTMDMMLISVGVRDDHGTDNEIRVNNAVSDGYDNVTWTLEIWVSGDVILAMKQSGVICDWAVRGYVNVMDLMYS